MWDVVVVMCVCVFVEGEVSKKYFLRGGGEKSLNFVLNIFECGCVRANVCVRRKSRIQN